MTRASPELLAAIRERDERALASMIETCTDPLLGAAWGLGWSGPEAEDLVQETLLTFLKDPGKFEGRSSLKTYLTGILYMKSKERRRTFRREDPTDPVDEVFENRFAKGGWWRTQPRGPEDLALSSETIQTVMECAQGLSEDQRMAFYLKEVEHESTDMICNALGVSVTHLGVLLFRARNKIRECVQKRWDGKR